MVGPKVQDELFDLLVRFRKHPVALSADVAKMYRQFRLADSDKDYYRFVWRDNRTDDIGDYRMTVVTFGVASSPHQAQRVLKQLAHDEKDNYPLAAPVLENDLYMDDVVSGAEDTASAICLQCQLDGITECAYLELRKWICNDPAFIQSVQKSNDGVLDMDLHTLDNPVRKTLGVVWDSSSGSFLYRVGFGVSEDQNPDNVTKRKLLSETYKVFDPLGLLASTVMCAKAMFQKLWLLCLNWDDVLPDTELRAWLLWKLNMKMLDTLKVDRCIVPKTGIKVVEYQLHGFGDTSEQGYAGVVYLRTLQMDGTVLVTLVCSKTKVAPTKQISLPRLELCTALLIARLLHRVQTALKLAHVTLHAWSDSTVTLDWIHGNPTRWKTFVANKVSEIQSLMNASQWRFCPGYGNPSDCASRGILASELVTHDLWWHGTAWLAESSENWPELHRVSDSVETKREMKSTRIDTATAHVHVVESNVVESSVMATFDLFPYSVLYKLVRISACCLRWLQARDPGKHVIKGPLTCAELDSALKLWIKQAQSDEFSEDIARLKAGEIMVSKNLQALCPFLNSEDVLCVGGRLQESTLKFASRHPILLPAKHKLTMLIIGAEHKRNLHAGPQLLLASLRQRYWTQWSRNRRQAAPPHDEGFCGPLQMVS
ncbi:uncharacterized protein LOC135498615 [Lineus longissimus]|uniref:uncharacterized protein LOC135498615 n=1 Tax=Lineus longissimus TaxID=88925 RepID=UPI00315D4346